MWQHLCMSMLMGLALAIPAQGAETQPATDVKSLCAELRSGDSIRQMNAANALGSLGEKAGPAAADLVKLLDAPSLEHQLMMHVVRPSPSLTAMNALLKIGPASTEALAAALKSDKTELRVNAVYVLVRLNVEKNLPILAPAATDSATAVRITLIRHLETVTSREALAMRLAALGDSEAAVRLAAVNGFRRFNPKPDTRYPIPADKRPDNYTLSIVAKAITPVLLQDSDPQIRATAAETLGELRTPTAVPSLIKAVADRDANVRKYAARSLGQLGQRQAVPPLLELLADKEQSVVIAAVSAAGRIGRSVGNETVDPAVAPRAGTESATWLASRSGRACAGADRGSPRRDRIDRRTEGTVGRCKCRGGRSAWQDMRCAGNGSAVEYLADREQRAVAFTAGDGDRAGSAS